MKRFNTTILIVLLWVAMLPQQAFSAAVPLFSVETLHSDLLDGVYHIDASFQLEFSDEMINALRNGVPLIFAIQVEMQLPRRFWWDETVVQLEQRYSLRFHALTQQYVVTDLNTELQHSFHSLLAAIEFFRHRTTLPTVSADLLKSDKIYNARLRILLVPEALPLALKVRAYSQRAWRATSPWVVWRID